MSEKFSDNITKIVVDYATRLQETEEEFIYQSISPFCCNVLQRKISKKELEEKLVRAERMKWITCSERMPDDDDYRDYLVLVENHIGDTPMICQHNSEYGFGYYKDIYDPVTLGYVDTEFSTLDELGYEKAMYWMQMPEPPVEEEGE